MFVINDEKIYCFAVDGKLYPIQDVKHLLHASLGHDTIIYILHDALFIMYLEPKRGYMYRGCCKNARKLISFDVSIAVIFDDYVQFYDRDKNIKTLPIPGILDIISDSFQKVVYTTQYGIYQYEKGSISQVVVPPGTIYTSGHMFGDLIHLIKDENNYSIHTKYGGSADSATLYINDHVIISFSDLSVVICPGDIFCTIPNNQISDIESNQKSIIITSCTGQRMIYSVEKTRYIGGSILPEGRLPMKKLVKRACSSG